MTPRRPTPAQVAREQAGFSVKEAARRAQITAEHYAKCEARNEFVWGQAMFLARLFGCSPWALHPLAMIHEREGTR